LKWSAVAANAIGCQGEQTRTPAVRHKMRCVLGGMRPRNAANNAGNASGVRGDLGVVGLSDAGILALVAGNAAPAEIFKFLFLDLLFENGRLH
jgi:hypothetical protein